MPMPRKNRPVPTDQPDLFPPPCPGPDRASLPKEARQTAARLMARMLAEAANAAARNRAGGRGDE
jgi:hypothetical protein